MNLYPVKIEYTAIVAAENEWDALSEVNCSEIMIHEEPKKFVGKPIKVFKGSGYEEWDGLIPYGDNGEERLTCKDILNSENDERRDEILAKLTAEEIAILGIEG